MQRGVEGIFLDVKFRLAANVVVLLTDSSCSQFRNIQFQLSTCRADLVETIDNVECIGGS